MDLPEELCRDAEGEPSERDEGQDERRGGRTCRWIW